MKKKERKKAQNGYSDLYQTRYSWITRLQVSWGSYKSICWSIALVEISTSERRGRISPRQVWIAHWLFLKKKKKKGIQSIEIILKEKKRKGKKRKGKKKKEQSFKLQTAPTKDLHCKLIFYENEEKITYFFLFLFGWQCVIGSQQLIMSQIWVRHSDFSTLNNYFVYTYFVYWLLTTQSQIKKINGPSRKFQLKKISSVEDEYQSIRIEGLLQQANEGNINHRKTQILEHPRALDD